MRRSVVASVLAGLALAACDAGNKEAVNRPAGPSLYVTTPRMDQVLRPPAKEADGKPVEPKVWLVDVMLDLRDSTVSPAVKKPDGTYEPGSGQHVHVILDDEPYLAIYDVSKPVRLEVKSEGTHVVRAFPSAGPADAKGAKWHESRKNPGAFAWVRFHVNEKGGPLESFDGSKPLLTYSRPKGEYKTGDSDAPLLFPLMVDFHLTNVVLGGRDHRVRVTFDDRALPEILEWKPVFLEGEPAAGEHTVLVELLDRDGNLVPGPFSKTERKITVKPAAPPRGQ